MRVKVPRVHYNIEAGANRLSAISNIKKDKSQLSGRFVMATRRLSRETRTALLWLVISLARVVFPAPGRPESTVSVGTYG